MGRLGDLFAPSDVGYPGYPGSSAGGNAGGNYQPPARTGFFNQFFAPTDLPYPLPAGFTSGPILAQLTPTATAPSAGAPSRPAATQAGSTTPAAPTPPGGAATGSGSVGTSGSQQASAPSQSPVTVIVQSCPPAASSTGSGATSTGGASSTMPVGNCPVPPAEQIVTAFSTNPRLRARTPRGQELLLEEMTGESLSLRMLSKDSAPVGFVVPDHCNAVDFTFGAIELNPCHGRPGDLDDAITVGALKVEGLDPIRPLTPGDQLSVVVPWRHGSWVELAADRLRVPIVARFYQVENA